MSRDTGWNGAGLIHGDGVGIEINTGKYRSREEYGTKIFLERTTGRKFVWEHDLLSTEDRYDIASMYKWTYKTYRPQTLRVNLNKVVFGIPRMLASEISTYILFPFGGDRELFSCPLMEVTRTGRMLRPLFSEEGEYYRMQAEIAFKQGHDWLGLVRPEVRAEILTVKTKEDDKTIVVPKGNDRPSLVINLSQLKNIGRLTQADIDVGEEEFRKNTVEVSANGK